MARSPRRLAWVALLGLAALLALARPRVAPVAPAVPDPAPAIRVLEEGSPWQDRARLADPAFLVTPPVRLANRGPETSAPEATPFPPFPPDLRSSREGSLQLPLLSSAASSLPAPADLPPLAQPLETLGERVPRALPPARPPMLRASASLGGLVIERPIEGDEIYKYINNNGLSKSTLPALGLAIDAFGIQGSPILLAGTGDAEADRALLAWAGRQPWAAWLPPGAYRVEIGP